MIFEKIGVNKCRLYSRSVLNGLRTDPKWLGIYSLKINFSRTLLSTGARNSNQIVIYKVPSLDLVCVCQSFTFEVFDMVWLDDEFLVSCSADMKLVLWHIDSNLVDPSDNAERTIIKYIEPVHVLECNFAIREITFNKTTKEIAVLTLNNFIRTWSCTPDRSFEPKSFKELPELGHYASLATHDDGSYAIGCSRRILFLDTRLEKIKDVPDDNVLGITSASFQGSILTMGTLMKLMFYDVRTQKYLKSIESDRIVSLNASYTSLWRDSQKSPPLFIHTHCYNPSSTELFMGGGSLESGCGYAGIWQYE